MGRWIKHIDVVLDGPSSPTGGQFVEVEDGQGNSIGIGKWMEQQNEYWIL
jgi:hypothetical protein